MKWFKNEELVSTKEKRKELPDLTVRFNKKEKRNGATVTMHLNKGVIAYAQEKGFTHVRFGIDTEQGVVGLQFNKKKQGFDLRNKNEQYRSIINVNGLYTQLAAESIDVAYEEKITLNKVDDTTFSFPYTSLNEVQSQPHDVKLSDYEDKEIGEDTGEKKETVEV